MLQPSRKNFYYCVKFKGVVIHDPSTYYKALKARNNFLVLQPELSKSDFKISRIRKNQYDPARFTR